VKPARNRTNRTASIRGGENAFSQILRIRLPPTPKHLTLRCAVTGVLKITSGTPFGSPRESSQSSRIPIQRIASRSFTETPAAIAASWSAAMLGFERARSPTSLSRAAAESSDNPIAE
jgi:hypothetical protein